MTTGLALYPLEGASFDPLRDKSYRRTRLGRSVADFLAWKKLGRAAERTLDQYERDLARLALMFPKLGVAEIGGAEIAHWAGTFSEPQRYARVAAARSFFKWAIRWRHRVDNPCDFLPEIRRTERPPIEVFDEAEIKALTGLPLADGVLFQLMFDAGLRKGECRAMAYGWFRPPGEFTVRGKGSKWRIVPATSAVTRRLAELALIEGLNPQDHLWYRNWRNVSGHGVSRERPIGEATFVRWWERSLEAAGVRYRHPHTTRHTFATRYLRAGGDLHYLSRIMGHASIKTTFDLYGHLTSVDLHAQFAEIFGE